VGVGVLVLVGVKVDVGVGVLDGVRVGVKVGVIDLVGVKVQVRVKVCVGIGAGLFAALGLPPVCAQTGEAARSMRIPHGLNNPGLWEEGW
jgi:hypothetical protein